MFPSSTPRPCRHTDGGQVPQNLQLPLLTSTLAGLSQTIKDHFTFLFTAVDDLKIFGDIGTLVGLHVGVREADRTVVTHLPVARKDAFHRAVPCRTASSPA